MKKQLSKENKAFAGKELKSKTGKELSSLILKEIGEVFTFKKDNLIPLNESCLNDIYKVIAKSKLIKIRKIEDKSVILIDEELSKEVFDFLLTSENIDAYFLRKSRNNRQKSLTKMERLALLELPKLENILVEEINELLLKYNITVDQTSSDVVRLELISEQYSLKINETIARTNLSFIIAEDAWTTKSSYIASKDIIMRLSSFKVFKQKRRELFNSIKL